MRRQLIIIIVSMLALAVSRNEAELTSSKISKELDAIDFVKKSTEELQVIYKKFRDLPESIVIPVSDEDNDKEIAAANSKLIDDLEVSERMLFNISSKARSFDFPGLNNGELKYTIGKLKNAGSVFRLGGANVIKLATYMNALTKVYTDKAVQCTQGSYGFDALSHCDNTMFAHGNNLSDITYYWQIRNEHIKKNAAVAFFDTVQMIQNAAKRYNMKTAEFWYLNYSEEVMSEMTEIFQMLRPFYQQVHAYVRYKLYKIHGADIIKQNGPIPQQLYEKIVHQFQFENDTDEYFKEDFPITDLPNYNNILKAKNYAGEKLLEVAEKFYQSIGFDSLTEKFWEYNIYKIGNTETCSPANTVNHDISEYCNSEPEFRKFAQHHVQLGRIYADYMKKDLPAHFDDGHFLGRTLGNTVKLAATTPKHLKAIGLLNNFEYSKKSTLNRNFHNAIEVMFSLANSYIGVKVLTGILEGNIDKLELNNYYWQLMAEYVGVEPPLDRNKDDLDLPYYIFEDLLHNTNVVHKFTENILSYQFYSAICKKIGYTGMLDNCDFNSNLVIGRTLSEMLSMGSSKPFNEIVEPLLPKYSTLNGKSLLDYFEPTHQWMTIYLESEGITPGWEHTAKRELYIRRPYFPERKRG